MKLDSIDKKLINLLQEDSKRTNKQLSLLLNLSVTAVFERIKKLERAEIITRYIAQVNPKKVDKSFTLCIRWFFWQILQLEQSANLQLSHW